MNTYDLRTAFYLEMTALTYNDLTTLKPDEVFDASDAPSNNSLRRGAVMLAEPYTAGFGDGIYTRTEGIYQIDIWVPRKIDNALQRLDALTDAHILQFFPANGRGKTVTRNSTSGHIVHRPGARPMGRAGSYITTQIDVLFYVEEYPSV